MPESRNDPLADMISFVAGPISGVIKSFEQLRRMADETIKGVENFNATMANLNETASRVNRLLNDFEEPIRAVLPQIQRTVKAAEDLTQRLHGPIEAVAPGLNRLADTLNSPVITSMPTDLSVFLDIINDVGRRLAPLGQIAEQAGNFFGLRIPGLSRPAPAARPAPPPPAVEPPEPRFTVKQSAAKKTTARKATARKTTARKTTARKTTARKR